MRKSSWVDANEKVQILKIAEDCSTLDEVAERTGRSISTLYRIGVVPGKRGQGKAKGLSSENTNATFSLDAPLEPNLAPSRVGKVDVPETIKTSFVSDTPPPNPWMESVEVSVGDLETGMRVKLYDLEHLARKTGYPLPKELDKVSDSLLSSSPEELSVVLKNSERSDEDTQIVLTSDSDGNVLEWQIGDNCAIDVFQAVPPVREGAVGDLEPGMIIRVIRSELPDSSIGSSIQGGYTSCADTQSYVNDYFSKVLQVDKQPFIDENDEKEWRDSAYGKAISWVLLADVKGREEWIGLASDGAVAVWDTPKKFPEYMSKQLVDSATNLDIAREKRAMLDRTYEDKRHEYNDLAIKENRAITEKEAEDVERLRVALSAASVESDQCRRDLAKAVVESDDELHWLLDRGFLHMEDHTRNVMDGTIDRNYVSNAEKYELLQHARAHFGTFEDFASIVGRSVETLIKVGIDPEVVENPPATYEDIGPKKKYPSSSELDDEEGLYQWVRPPGLVISPLMEDTLENIASWRYAVSRNRENYMNAYKLIEGNVDMQTEEEITKRNKLEKLYWESGQALEKERRRLTAMVVTNKDEFHWLLNNGYLHMDAHTRNEIEGVPPKYS